MYGTRWIPIGPTISLDHLVGTLGMAPHDMARKSAQSLAWAQDVQQEVNLLKTSFAITSSAENKPVETMTEDALAVMQLNVTIKGYVIIFSFLMFCLIN